MFVFIRRVRRLKNNFVNNIALHFKVFLFYHIQMLSIFRDNVPALTQLYLQCHPARTRFRLFKMYDNHYTINNDIAVIISSRNKELNKSV